MKKTSKPCPHKTELRPKQIKESYCVQKGCKFHNKPAEQGICFSTESGLGGTSWKHIEKAEESALDLVNGLKKHAKNQKDYVEHLESYLICTWMNNEFTLDELVYLRRKVALLELKKRTPTT